MNELDYFALRDVNPATYDNYQIPRYLHGILNDPNASILDFGCGFGQLLIALRERGFNSLEGADISAEALSHLLEHGLKASNPGDDSFFEQRVASFDYVVLSHVLEHFPKEEIIPLLRRLRGLLKHTGSLLVMVPNAQSNTGCYWAYEDFTHSTIFTAGALYFVLRAAGFKQVTFLDIDCTAGMGQFKRNVRRLLLMVYRSQIAFWNWVTASSYHRPSPQIFSYEIKACASG